MKENVKYQYGCIMGIVDPKTASTLLKISKKLIPDDALFFEEGQEYGRETECHITVKFGFTNHYSEEAMGKVMSKIKPFSAVLDKIDLFQNPKFDVVKYNVVSEELNRLNNLFKKLPNKDEYPIYHPHLTIAYVKPGQGKQFLKKISPVEIEITRMKYSNPVGKYFYDLSPTENDTNLQEGAVERIDLKIKQLEDEWNRLDSQGTQIHKQQQISTDLQKLRKQKQRWEDLWNTVR